MPTYEYECDKCKHKFDVFQSMSAKLVKKCPECGGKVTRLLGAGSGIIFKGSGFYQTDYKNPSTRAQGSIPSEARDKNKKSSGGGKSCDPSAHSACSGSSRAKSRDDKPKADGCKGCSHNHGK